MSLRACACSILELSPKVLQYGCIFPLNETEPASPPVGPTQEGSTALLDAPTFMQDHVYG